MNADTKIDSCAHDFPPYPHWQEITERLYEYFRDVLPPIYGRGAFAVSEPLRHNDDGRAVYTLCRETGGRFYACTGTLPELRGAA